MVYNIYMYRDHDNFILKDILTKEEIVQIYDYLLTKKEHERVFGLLGHVVNDAMLPENILNKVINLMNNTLGYSVKLSEHAFTKYTRSSGYVPKLFPHVDEVFKEPRITLDLQIGGNVSWPLYVKGNKYVLENNQALIFSGTHQVHWREDQNLSNDDYLDMIFFHFVSDEYPEFESDYRNHIESEIDFWNQKVNIIKKEEKV